MKQNLFIVTLNAQLMIMMLLTRGRTCYSEHSIEEFSLVVIMDISGVVKKMRSNMSRRVVVHLGNIGVLHIGLELASK